jgi:hypothetical protein
MLFGSDSMVTEKRHNMWLPMKHPGPRLMTQIELPNQAFMSTMTLGESYSITFQLDVWITTTKLINKQCALMEAGKCISGTNK